MKLLMSGPSRQHPVPPIQVFHTGMYRETSADHALPLAIAGFTEPQPVEGIGGLLLLNQLLRTITHEMAYPGTFQGSHSNQNDGSKGSN